MGLFPHQVQIWLQEDCMHLKNHPLYTEIAQYVSLWMQAVYHMTLNNCWNEQSRNEEINATWYIIDQTDYSSTERKCLSPVDTSLCSITFLMRSRLKPISITACTTGASSLAFNSRGSTRYSTSRHTQSPTSQYFSGMVGPYCTNIDYSINVQICAVHH